MAENESVSNSQTSDVHSAGEPGGRREPPTIDLDASDVSGDTNAAARRRARKLFAMAGTWLRSGADHAAPIAAGGIAAFAVSAGFWLVDAQLRRTPTAPPAAESIGDFVARLARIEARIERPSAAPAATATPAPEFVARISASEQTLQSMRDTISAMRRQLDGVTSALAEVKAKGSEAVASPPPVDLSPLVARVDGLDRALASLKQRLAEHPVAAAPERPLRRVAAAVLLDAAVRQGQGFAAELAVAKSLAEAPDKLAPLDVFAARGVPTDAAKCRELLALVPKLRPSPEPVAPDASAADRFWANATRLVRIRPAGETAGDDAAALATQIETAARRGDLAEAIRLIAKLPESARAEMTSFLNGVKVRDAALAASRQLAADALAALDKPTR